jgi:hypothetical protein
MAVSPNFPRVPSELASAAVSRPEGFAIRLPSAQLGDLIQINCLNRIRGAFRVSSGVHRGHLFFEQGQLIHADFGAVTGLDAVVQMLGWRGGSIEPCVQPWPKQSTIDMGADVLLLRAAQRLDEAARADTGPEATTKVVRRAPWPAELLPTPALAENEERIASEGAERPSLASALAGERISHLQVARVTLDGTIQQLKAGASTELADTAFFCQRMASMIGETLELGECRAVSLEGPRESIVVFRGRSIVGTRGKTADLEFIRKKVGLT